MTWPPHKSVERGRLLSSCDVVVLGGFHSRPRTTSSHSKENEKEKEKALPGLMKTMKNSTTELELGDVDADVVDALERSGMVVGLASGSDKNHGDDGRREVAAALSVAIEEESCGRGDGDIYTGDGTQPSDKGKKNTVRALVVVGLGVSGPHPCEAFLNDHILRASVRRFAQQGGLVLLHGRGRSVDEVTQGWFGKPWASGVPKSSMAGACRWEYNDGSAWGAGYFARYNASPHKPSPSAMSCEVGGYMMGLEGVDAAERIFASRDSSTTWQAYGGGHVGFFGNAEAGEATMRVVIALVDAAPGVNNPAAGRRQLRRWHAALRGTSGRMDGGVGGSVLHDETRRVDGRMRTFMCYAACSLTLTTVFVALLALLILIL